MEKKSGYYRSLILIVSIFALALTAVGNTQPVTGTIAEYSSPQVTLPAIASTPAPETPHQVRWHLSRILAQQTWEITTSQPDILVAVLDTGIDSSHEVLRGKVVAVVNFTGSPVAEDYQGHGTHIAGTIAASPEYLAKAAGLAYSASLLNVKVAEDDGSCNAATVAKGIIWAVDHGAQVINLSLTITKPSQELEDAVNYAWGKGSIVVAAAGNTASTKTTYPAAYLNVIAVAATDTDDYLPWWSNRGDWVDVAAPGVSIYSSTSGGK